MKGIKGKLFWIITAIALIPTVVISLLFYYNVQDSFQDQLSNTVLQSMVNSVEEIDDNLRAVESTNTAILRSPAVEQMSVGFWTDTMQIDWNNVAEIKQVMVDNSLLEAQQFQYMGIDSYMLKVENQPYLVDSKRGLVILEESGRMDFLKAYQVQDIPRWLPTETADFGFSIGGQERNYITCVKYIYTLTGEVMVSLLMNVDEYYIDKKFIEYDEETGGKTFVMDKDGVIISHYDKTLLRTIPEEYEDIRTNIATIGGMSGNFLTELNGENYFVVYTASTYNGWLYLNIMPADVLDVSMVQITKMLYAIIPLMLLILLLCTWMIANVFYKPIQKVSTAMERVREGDFSWRIEDTRDDEYATIYDGFNQMTVKIQDLVVALTNEQIMKQTAEIKFLQAQINPHFLYNVLDSMYAMAVMNYVEELPEMIQAISRFYRKRIGKDMEHSTLHNALELIKDYITIQNIRHHGKITYSVDVPVEFYNCIIPPLLLQPLVENAIIHGLEPKSGPWKISVSAVCKGKDLYITVEDDGIGLSSEELQDLISSMEIVPKEGQFIKALNNLHLLLQLKYGKKYGITIESQKDKGAKVVVKIPRQFDFEVLEEGDDE